MSPKIAPHPNQRPSSTVIAAPSVVLIAAHGRLNQCASSRAIADLTEIVAANDPETQRFVAALQADLVRLERRVQALESTLAKERSSRGRFSWGIWGAIRRAFAWTCALFRGRE